MRIRTHSREVAAAVLAAAILVGGTAAVRTLLVLPASALLVPYPTEAHEKNDAFGLIRFVTETATPFSGAQGASRAERPFRARPAASERNGASEAMGTAQPMRLQIPHIRVDAPVVRVGINGVGNMATPSSFSEVGWYRHGPRPGEPGSAVLAGHVDNALGFPGVFKRLGELREGDVLYITVADGTALRFVVASVETHPYNDAPTNEIFSTGGAPRVTLITCAGSWLRSAGTYDTRLVVTAYLADDK
ncbi:class F sortase [Candidatus Kaiserbacteria bacterium CG10_big_fil_rev_8_21_14_0_10_59_10]|uniref:Class F sortase n=1 Tax=Candidatus Kaiserbacteria bacterium CG10_big_fil_rev_8_21_14_0_10_59_10 TaxID=1974612 RepID=A0A2H0U6Y3_9BACT|nr:MAG: class F sortase [Candidatus Kaiserbacteria bacterium CG10_big_fil_rev_8_21_14_0_10_59_10]